MLKKTLALLVIAMLIVPATALAKGKPNIATSASQSQSIAVQDSSDDMDAAEEGTQKEDGRNEKDNPSANHGKGKSVRAEESSEVDLEVDLSDEEDPAKEKKEKLTKDDKEALKEARKAEKEAEKEALKAQKDSKNANEDDVDIDSDENSSAVESDDMSETAGAVKHGKKFWDKNDSETADNELYDKDSSTATARGKGIVNAMSKIVRNIERMGEKASDALKRVVNKFAMWLHLVLPFSDVSGSEDSQIGTPSSGDSSTTAGGGDTTGTVGGVDTTSTVGSGNSATTDTTSSIGSGETSTTSTAVITN